jgi:proteic killer suppression protein
MGRIERMICTYRDKRTRNFAAGQRVKVFDGIVHRLSMKLDQLDAATTLRDLDLPGNRLEALKRDRKGQYSIRVNDQWRICLRAQRAQ